MRKTKLIQKIGGTMLSMALMAGLWMLVFMLDDSTSLDAHALGKTISGSNGDVSAAYCAKLGGYYCVSGGNCLGWEVSGSDISCNEVSCNCSISVAKEGSSPMDNIEGSIRTDISIAVSKAAKQPGAASPVINIDGRRLQINTLSREIIRALNKAGVGAVFSFDYMGQHYVITIPAGKTLIKDDVPWLGPKYLMSLYGDTAVVTPIKFK